MIRITFGVLAVLYAVSWAGWWLHESPQPWILGYSRGYLLFLALAFLPLPLLAYPAGCRDPRRRRRYLGSLAAGLVAVVLLHEILAGLHHATVEYRFDPFLQVAPPRIPAGHGQGPGTLRILTLGGSTTQGIGLPAGQDYPSVLGSELRRRTPGRDVAVFNAGTPWYTTRHSLIAFTTEYDAWQPRIVVVMHGFNDLYRSFAPRAYARGDYDPRWTHYYGPAIRGAVPPGYLSWLLDCAGMRSLPDRWASTWRRRERDLDPGAYRSRPDFRRHLERLVHYLSSRGCLVVLVTEPSLYRADLTPDLRRRLWLRWEFCRLDGDPLLIEAPSPGSLRLAMDAFNDEVRRAAATGGCLLVDAAHELDGDPDVFEDDVHHTATGAARLAGLIAERLAAEGLLEEPTEATPGGR